MGRRNKYAEIKERLPEIIKWVESGFTDKEVAQKLGIAYSTFNDYLKKYSEFSEAIKRAKVKPNEAVENSLYKKATGFYVPVIKNYKLKTTTYGENGRKIKEEEILVEKEEQEYFPPETAAIIFYLINRMKNKWNNNPQKLDIEKAMLEIAQKKAESEDF